MCNFKNFLGLNPGPPLERGVGKEKGNGKWKEGVASHLMTGPGRHQKLYRAFHENTKFQARKLLHQSIKFSAGNAPKLTYEHL